MTVAPLQPGDQLGHGVDLIAGKIEVGDEGEAVERCRHAGPGERRRRCRTDALTTHIGDLSVGGARFNLGIGTAGCGSPPRRRRPVRGEVTLARPHFRPGRVSLTSTLRHAPSAVALVEA